MNDHLYAYVRPIYMHGHMFMPDIALTLATDLDSAIDRFQSKYEFASAMNVREVRLDQPVVTL